MRALLTTPIHPTRRRQTVYPSAASDVHAICVGEVRHAISPVPIHFGTPKGRSRGGIFSRSAFLNVFPEYGVESTRYFWRHMRPDLRQPYIPVRTKASVVAERGVEGV